MSELTADQKRLLDMIAYGVKQEFQNDKPFWYDEWHFEFPNLSDDLKAVLDKLNELAK